MAKLCLFEQPEPSKEIFDCIIIGLGVMGMSTLYELSKDSKAKVLGIDKYTPPHSYGSSNVETKTRVLRAAPGEGEQYVPLVKKSIERLTNLETEAKLKAGSIYNPIGGLMIAPKCPQKSMRSDINNFVEASRQTAAKHNVKHSVYDNTQLSSQYPELGDITSGLVAYYENAMGYIDIEKLLTNQLEIAKSNGAKVKSSESFIKFENISDNLIRVKTDKGSYITKQLVLAMGPWLPQHLENTEFKGVVTRQIVMWFEFDESHKGFYKNAPVIVWDLDGSYFFTTPSLDDNNTVRIGFELYQETTPETVNRQVSQQEIDEIYSKIKDKLPGITNNCVKSKVCLLTNTEDGNFIIDHHPDDANVIIVSACSGHGFKHGPAIGYGLAKQIITKDDPLNLLDTFGNKLSNRSSLEFA